MLKIALIAAAASKSKSTRRAAADAAEVLLIPIVIAIVVLCGFLFIFSPIYGIVGAAKLISGNFDVAVGMMSVASIGGFFSMVFGLCLTCVAIEEMFFPAPWYFEEDSEDVRARRKKNRKGCLWLTLGGLATAGLIVWMTVLAVMQAEVNCVLSGILFIILFSLSLILIIVGAIGKLLFG